MIRKKWSTPLLPDHKRQQGGVYMLWAYFLSNTCTLYGVDNTPLFKLIQECQMDEDSIFTDDMTADRTERDDLMGHIQRGDTLIVRSLVDLADNADDLVVLLQEIEAKGVDIASVSEPWYEYKRSFEQVSRGIDIVRELAEKKRRMGMQRAKVEGRMGRKADGRKAEQMRKLRAVGLTVREITELCRVSRSTYYRQVGKN